ncbi:MAG: flagellar protein FlaG [Gallionella sp.]|nr:flagellar protein FlaG [Gallionella sp.]
MIIQNSTTNQAAAPVRLTSDGAPNVVVDTSNAGSASGVQQAAPQQPSSGQLQNAVDGINLAMRQANQNLEFSVDTSTNKPVVKMVDTQTGDLIRQFPSEETLAIARSIDQFLQRQGLLLSQKA